MDQRTLARGRRLDMDELMDELIDEQVEAVLSEFRDLTSRQQAASVASNHRVSRCNFSGQIFNLE